MLSKDAFIDFILHGPDRGPAAVAPGVRESALPEGFEGFEEVEAAPVATRPGASFARRLLEASGFGYPDLVQRGNVIRSTDAVARYLPERVAYWPKAAARPYQTLLFEADLTHRDLLGIPAFKTHKLAHLDLVEDALARLVSEALEGFARGGEGVTAEVRKGRKEETLCVVSILDAREGEPVRLICFGTENRSTGGLETFLLTEQTRSWDPMLAQERLGLLYERQFRRLEGADWQEAFTTTEERSKAEDLLFLCTSPAPTEQDIQEGILELLDIIAKGYGLRKPPKRRRLQAFALPPDHDIGIDPEERERTHGGRNPFGGVTLRDEQSRLLGYIIYPLKNKADAAKLRRHLEQHNRFHNVLVVYPDEDQARLELWQGREQLIGKLRKGQGPKDAAEVVNLLSRFFVVSKAKVKNPTELAQELAYRARFLRKVAVRQLSEEAEQGLLRSLYLKFKKALVHNQTEEEFADAYAQILTYGILSARWLSKDEFIRSGERFTRETAAKHMPTTSKFLKDFFREVLGASFSSKLTWLLEDIADLLERTDIERVLNEKHDDSLVFEDPVIHFYEPFLAEYDYEIKIDRGVFYTPSSVVKHIVDSIDLTIREEWNLPLGLADSTKSVGAYLVNILDPAVGTGTFLRQVILRIHKTMVNEVWVNKTCEEIDKLWNEYVRRDLLPRVHGFEIMVAPFAICHMRLARTLQYDTHFKFAEGDRIQVQLTNSLDDVLASGTQTCFEFGFLSDESAAARKLKSEIKITVVLGNPPYAGLSSNLEPHHRKLVERYKTVLGTKFKPRNPLQFEKNINDDYVKFLALSQHILDRSKNALLGMITNHSYIDGEYYVGVRSSLIGTFDKVWCLDCHGNKDKKEFCPDGTPDENLFSSITTGVAILVASRRESVGSLRDGTLAVLACGDLFGLRSKKFSNLASHSIAALTANTETVTSSYLFRAANELSSEFDAWPALDKLMPEYSGATETGFDELLLAFSKGELMQKVRSFVMDHDDPLRSKALTAEKGRAREIAENPDRLDLKNADRYVRPIQFRPFDWRYGYLKKDILKTNAFGNMLKLSQARSGLATTSKSKMEFGAFAVADFFCHKMVQTYDRAFVFPQVSGESGRTEQNVEEYHKIVAILHSREYALRYRESLKVGLPRIPALLPAALAVHLAKIGADIVAIETCNLDYPYASWVLEKRQYTKIVAKPRFEGADRTVDKRCICYKNDRLAFSKTAAFIDVPLAAWKYKVGSFSVLESWFQQRDGHTLSEDEQVHIQTVVVYLSHLAEYCSEVDNLIAKHGGWPGAFVTKPSGAPK